MHFLDDYASARRQFRQAAKATGARLMHFELPGHHAPGGGDLTIDAAWLGPERARRVLLVTSGMHGFEGPAGSAVQCCWLEEFDGALPHDTAVLHLHALNPWGFAWVSRLTENNVDLNRNFLDWSAPAPVNPYYRHVRESIRVSDMSVETLARLGAVQQRLALELGPAAARIAVDYGQYEDPEGLSFGGSEPEFAHTVLERDIAPMLAHARHVGLIDWHTGVGAYGELAILPIDGAGSDNAARIEAWWGRARVNNWKRSALEDEIERDPAYATLPQLKTGQMKQAIARWLPGAQITGAVVEFGTETEGALPDLIFVTLYERWLRFVDRGDRMAPSHKRFRDTALQCFAPRDGAWRAFVIETGPPLIDAAVHGLGKLDV